MGLRPWHCYRDDDKTKPAYTRIAIRVPKKDYIGGVPGLRIRQFSMGNKKGKFEYEISIVSKERMLVRENALEAARRHANRLITLKAGKEGYFMKLRVYPHRIIRENKQAQGAGADRIQQGMRHPFGKPIGRAARVREEQKIFSIFVNKEHVNAAKEALRLAVYKLPFKCKIVVEKNDGSVVAN